MGWLNCLSLIFIVGPVGALPRGVKVWPGVPSWAAREEIVLMRLSTNMIGEIQIVPFFFFLLMFDKPFWVSKEHNSQILITTITWHSRYVVLKEHSRTNKNTTVRI